MNNWLTSKHQMNVSDYRKNTLRKPKLRLSRRLPDQRIAEERWEQKQQQEVERL